MDKLFLATIFGVSIGLSLKIFYDWKYTSTTPEQVVSPEAIPDTPVKEINNTQYIISTIDATLRQAHEEQELLSQITYITLSDDRSPKEYQDLEVAILNLHHRKQANIESALTLKIKFPSELITKYKSEQKFRAWLALLGDFIFLKRILYLEDVGDALRSPDFMRICPDQICERGNLIFTKLDNFWQLDIRGLNNFNNNIKKINSVAKILLYALHNPTKITNYVYEEPEDFSIQVNQYLRDNNQTELSTQKDKELCDRFIGMSIYTKNFKELNIKHNKSAFLPLVDFSKLPNLQEKQRELLLLERNSFLKDFSQKIIPLLSTLPNSNIECVCQLRDAHYVWLVNRVVFWATSTDLTTILKNALFKA